MVSASYSNWRNELQLNEGMGLGIAAGAAALAAAPYLAKKFLKPKADKALQRGRNELHLKGNPCLLYTSPSPRDYAASRMPSSA